MACGQSQGCMQHGRHSDYTSKQKAEIVLSLLTKQITAT